MLRPYYCSVHFRPELFLGNSYAANSLVKGMNEREKFLSLRPKANKNNKGRGENCLVNERFVDIKKAETEIMIFLHKI